MYSAVGFLQQSQCVVLEAECFQVGALLLGCWKAAGTLGSTKGAPLSGASFSLLKGSRDFHWVKWAKCPEQCQETSVLFNLSRELFLASCVEVTEMCWLFFRLDPYRPLWEALWNNFKLSQR